MRARSLLILALATAAAAVAAILAQRDTGDVARAGELVFPALLERINDTARVIGTSGGETFTLERDDGRWVVAEKSRYPADQEQVRRLLLGAAALERIEPKTANPELYPKLGLGDVSSEESGAVRYTLEGTDGDPLAEIVVGDSQPAKGNPTASEYYVREPDDPQSWLVQGRLPGAADAVEWLDQQVLELDRERVHEVRVRHADGEEVAVRKREPSQQGFDLLDLPEGTEVDAQWKLNDMGKALTDLELDDVMPAGRATLAEDTPAYRVELVTFDGLRVRMSVFEREERKLARLEAEFDESLVAEDLLPAAEGAESAAEEDGGEARAKLRGAEAVREQAARLNALWRDWVYEIPDYRSGYLSKRREELVKRPEEAAREGES